MQTLTSREITNLYTIGLTGVIANWQDYDQQTVLLAYAELQKRDYVLPKILAKSFSDFCIKNNYNDIDKSLITYIKDSETLTYQENIEPNKTPVQSDYTQNYMAERKYPALLMVIKYLNWVAWLVAIIIIIVILATFSLDTALLSKLTIAVPALIIGSVIFVLLLASAESIKVLIDIESNTRKAAEKREHL